MRHLPCYDDHVEQTAPFVYAQHDDHDESVVYDELRVV
jgi:hypothetical protein